MLPNVLIGGAPKAGTTSVFRWLADHPEVATSSRKETCFFYDRGQFRFDPEANHHDHPLARYERYFAGAPPSAKVVLEASPGYLHARTALDVIPGLASEPRMIFILRKPTERFYSSYRFMVHRAKRLDPRRPLAEVVAEARAGRLFFDPVGSSRYLVPVSRWLEAMGRERVATLLFDDLRDDPGGLMGAVSAFVGIDAGFWDGYGFVVANPTFDAAAGPRIPEEHRAVLAALDRELAPEVEALGRLIGRDLGGWL